MKISGFTFLRSAEKFGYPFVASSLWEQSPAAGSEDGLNGQLSF